MQSWSLIIFFYNEEENVLKVCEQAIDFLAPLPEGKKEIIFINDGSSDQSVEQIKKIIEDKPYIKLITHENNLGIGASLKSGYKIAQMENICALPGDGQFNINELKAFRFVSPKTVISFFRVKHRHYSLFREFLTQANRWLNKLLFRLDNQDVNWVKIYKKSDISQLNFRSNSSFIETEIIYKLQCKACKIIQSPSQYQMRVYGHSKAVTWSVLKNVGRDIIVLLIKK